MVIKDLASSHNAYYITTFIPDPGSTGKVRCENFVRGKKHNKYSGLVLYVNPRNGSPVRVDRYVKGERIGGVFMAGDLDDAIDKAIYAEELMGDIAISQVSLASARSYSENDWDWGYSDNDGGGNNNMEDNGDGTWTYTDSNGNEYTLEDTDGDGKPDSVVLDEVIVTPPPVDPDPVIPDDGGDFEFPEEEPGNDEDNSEEESEEENEGTPSGGGGSSSTPANIKTPVELQNAASYAVNEVIRIYGERNAYCNKGVYFMFKKLFNNDTLANKNANAMVNYWKNNPAHWEQIDISQAQDLANKGHFVVSGWINYSGGSGHVTVIVPGETSYSNTWKGHVPMTMDTGANMRSTKQRLSQSYGKSKINGVLFF